MCPGVTVRRERGHALTSRNAPPYVIPRASLRRSQSLKFLSSHKSRPPTSSAYYLHRTACSLILTLSPPPWTRTPYQRPQCSRPKLTLCSLTSAEQQKFQSIIEQRQMKDFMTVDRTIHVCLLLQKLTGSRCTPISSRSAAPCTTTLPRIPN